MPAVCSVVVSIQHKVLVIIAARYKNYFFVPFNLLRNISSHSLQHYCSYIDPVSLTGELAGKAKDVCFNKKLSYAAQLRILV